MIEVNGLEPELECLKIEGQIDREQGSAKFGNFLKSCIRKTQPEERLSSASILAWYVDFFEPAHQSPERTQKFRLPVFFALDEKVAGFCEAVRSDANFLGLFQDSGEPVEIVDIKVASSLVFSNDLGVNHSHNQKDQQVGIEEVRPHRAFQATFRIIIDSISPV